MFFTLLKKQILEILAFYFIDPKTGKRRSIWGIVGYMLIMGFLVISVCSLFLMYGIEIGDVLVNPLSPLSTNSWIFYAIFGITSCTVGVFFSIFSTYNKIYHATDNELLLSMPIKTGYILLSRIISIFVETLLYCGLVWITITIVYWIEVSTPTLAQIIFPFIELLFIDLFVVSIACVAGYFVALLTARVQAKSLFTVFFSLLFIVVYYSITLKAQELIQSLMLHVGEIETGLLKYATPICWLAKGATGDVGAMLLFILFACLCFGVCYFVMARSFSKITTTNYGEKKIVYKETQLKTSSVAGALLKKELKFFISTPTYILNQGFGLFAFVAACVFALLKQENFAALIYDIELLEPNIYKLIPAGLPALAMSIIGMNSFTSSSISLEGKSIWVTQSLPVSGWDCLKAKENMHLLLNGPLAVLTVVIVGNVLKLQTIYIVLGALLTAVYVYFTADLGLFMNLNWYNLNWSNPAVPCKQSLPVSIMIFGSFALTAAVIAGANYLKIKTTIYLGLWILLFVVITIVLNCWLRKKGGKIFERI